MKMNPDSLQLPAAVLLSYCRDCRDLGEFFFFQAEDGIRDYKVTGVQTCALPILMHALALLPCPPLPGSYRAFIQPIRVHNGLDGTSVGQQAHHDHDQLRWRAQSFQHGSPSCIKCALTHPTAIAIWGATMNPHVARSDFASCGTRLVRAKLFRRVHRLCCLSLHKYIMPMDSDFFKLSPQFHRLVGLYHLTLFWPFYDTALW